MNPGDLVKLAGYEGIPIIGIRRERGLSRGISVQRGSLAVVVAVEPADLHGRQDIGILVDGELLWIARGFLNPMQPT
jgi:hypothetical protein